MNELTNGWHAAFGVAMFGFLCLPFLMMLTSRRGLLVLGLRGSISAYSRSALLASVNIALIMVFVLVYNGLGATPLDVWHGATAWWHDGSLEGLVVAVLAWWMILSPLQTVIAIFSIRRQHKWEQKYHVVATGHR